MRKSFAHYREDYSPPGACRSRDLLSQSQDKDGASSLSNLGLRHSPQMKQVWQPPAQLSFRTREEDALHLQEPVEHILASKKKQDKETDGFTLQERESLKNAFRYITRLGFKQSRKYPQILAQISTEYNLSAYSAQRRDHLFCDAELISGERYFKEHIGSLDRDEGQLVVQFLLWFLRNKYLRHINKSASGGRGKRQEMRKDLYIRFKNHVMVPYLEGLLRRLRLMNDPC